jgi:hypothetical protein
MSQTSSLAHDVESLHRLPSVDVQDPVGDTGVELDDHLIRDVNAVIKGDRRVVWECVRCSFVHDEIGAFVHAQSCVNGVRD